MEQPGFTWPNQRYAAHCADASPAQDSFCAYSRDSHFPQSHGRALGAPNYYPRSVELRVLSVCVSMHSRLARVQFAVLLSTKLLALPMAAQRRLIAWRCGPQASALDLSWCIARSWCVPSAHGLGHCTTPCATRPINSDARVSPVR